MYMVKESLKSAINDVKIYSNGLETALDNKRMAEASDYVNSIRNSMDRIAEYIESHLSEEKGYDSEDPSDMALTDAERALRAARRAEEKVEYLERTSVQRTEEGKRLKKQAEEAEKEARRARDAAKKAQEAERKAAKQAMKAAKEAEKAREAAR
jgi:hypothetical protein